MGYEKPKDYVEVSERLIEFREKYPDGSLQSDPPEWVRDGKGELVGVTLRSSAFRTPDDVRPGHGTAYEPYPGKTPYTKGSEVMNAETSAWGRALIAVGAADAKKGIASANEVRNRQSDSAASVGKPAASNAPSVAQTSLLGQIKSAMKLRNVSKADVDSHVAARHGFGSLSEALGNERVLLAVLGWVEEQ